MDFGFDRLGVIMTEKNKKTVKEHYIPKAILEKFFSSNKFYESLVSSRKIYATTSLNAMCERNTYEHPELDENYIENILARTVDSKLVNAVDNIIANINNGNIGSVYQEACFNMYSFLICYFRSGAILYELKNSLKENIDETKIENFLKIIGDRRYLVGLAKTVVDNYKFAIINSGEENFILSDQYISTCSLKPKGMFCNISNRNIGLKETMILIPIQTKYYLVFYNGKNELNLDDNKVNFLSKDEVTLINTAIYNNSYNKVALKNADDFSTVDKERIVEKSPETCIMKFADGHTEAAGIKREVFLLKEHQESFDFFRNFSFNKYVNLGRNDKCLCGSNKKFKKCCIEKYNIASEMFENLKKENQSVYVSSPFAIVEVGVEIAEKNYQDIVEEVEKIRRKKSKI